MRIHDREEEKWIVTKYAGFNTVDEIITAVLTLKGGTELWLKPSHKSTVLLSVIKTLVTSLRNKGIVINTIRYSFLVHQGNLSPWAAELTICNAVSRTKMPQTRGITFTTTTSRTTTADEYTLQRAPLFT